LAAPLEQDFRNELHQFLFTTFGGTVAKEHAVEIPWRTQQVFAEFFDRLKSHSVRFEVVRIDDYLRRGRRFGDTLWAHAESDQCDRYRNRSVHDRSPFGCDTHLCRITPQFSGGALS
jgi:hypothetical protein